MRRGNSSAGYIFSLKTFSTNTSKSLLLNAGNYSLLNVPSQAWARLVNEGKLYEMGQYEVL